MNGDDIHYGLRMKLNAELNSNLDIGDQPTSLRLRVRLRRELNRPFRPMDRLIGDYTRIDNQLFEDLGEPRHV